MHHVQSREDSHNQMQSDDRISFSYMTFIKLNQPRHSGRRFLKRRLDNVETGEFMNIK